MVEDISKHIEDKVRAFSQREASSVDCLVDFHFQDTLMRLPMETKDGHVFESTLCRGYGGMKYLLAVSSQVGCASRCSFCELGKEGLSRSLTADEIMDQLSVLISTAMKRGYDVFSRPMKVTFVMGGEPLANKHMVDVLERMKRELPLQTKISTIFPASRRSAEVYRNIADIAADYPNIVQFQVSLNSTDESYRQGLVKIPLAGFDDIRAAGEYWFKRVSEPRKINLTFTLNDETPMDPHAIKDILPPDIFAIRLRDYVPTQTGEGNGVVRISSGRIDDLRSRFEDCGYFFVPGMSGCVEQKFRLAQGESLMLYDMIRS